MLVNRIPSFCFPPGRRWVRCPLTMNATSRPQARFATTVILLTVLLTPCFQALALPGVEAVESQPLLAQATRLKEAMEYLGTPLPAAASALLDQARQSHDDKVATELVQRAFDPLCFGTLRIHKDRSLHFTPANPAPSLAEQGWTTVLLKVINEAAAVATLRVDSPNSRPLAGSPPGEVDARWLELETLDRRPMNPLLSGLPLEYRPVQIYARKAGAQQATLAFNVSDPTQKGPGLDEVAQQSWNFDTDSEGWVAMHECTIAAGKGSLRVTSTGTDPYIGIKLAMAAGEKQLRFRVKTHTDAAWQVFWWTDQRGRPSGEFQKVVSVSRNDGNWSEYSVNFESESNLRGLRIDPGNGTGETLFDWIEISSRADASPVWLRTELTFTVQSSHPVTFRVRDERGQPTTAAFVIRDAQGRVYPMQSKRLAPDFFFHPQVYRANGEVMRLPVGRYTVECSRGPESVPEKRILEVAESGLTAKRGIVFDYRMQRWVDPARLGWFSGDHHIHAAGCKHYENPTEGVLPEDMKRHIIGEDLKVGANLTWGPCFDYQKQFFSGKADKVSKYPYLLRYDIEVSGFGSHQSGHLCLLRLRDQLYPGGDSKHHWPTLGLNTLRWAKAQGAVCGPAHSAIGLRGNVGRVQGGVEGPDGLPNFVIPEFNGIGANEFVMNITHEVPGPKGRPVPAVDFISTMNTDRRAEWNMWYHALNCGFRVRASGETDFPCISGARVGLGRVYVKQDGRLNYDDWCQGISDGRSYVSDGTSHLMEFTAASVTQRNRPVAVGERNSELKLLKPGTVRLSATVAIRQPGQETVLVEVIVNGYPVARQVIAADGVTRDLKFEVSIEQSSWVALRTYPSAHTNPIFVLVNGQPIRANRHSAEWLLRGVEQCWSQKERTYAEAEKQQARRDYDHARETYRKILAESPAQ